MKRLLCSLCICLINILCFSSVKAQTTGLLETTRSTKPSNPQAPKPASSATGPCNFCIDARSEVPPDTIRIDARNGTVTGKRRFKLKDKVRVEVININPFVCKGELTIQEAAIHESALGGFLAFLGVPKVDQEESLAGGQNETAARPVEKAPFSALLSSDNSLPLACPEPDKQAAVKSGLELIERLKAAALITIGELNSEVNGLLSRHKITKNQYATLREKLLNPHAECKELCEHSHELLRVLGNRITADEIKERRAKIAVLQANAKLLQSQIQDLRDKYPDCLNDKVRAYLAEKSVLADGFSTVATNFESKLNEVEKELKEFEKAEAEADKILKDPNAFQVTRVIGDYDTTTEATIEWKCGDTKITDKVKFGDAPFFTLSGGIVFSTLAKQEIDKIQGFELDRNGLRIGNELTTVIGLKEKSATRISPLVMLSGRLWTPGDKAAKRLLGMDGVHLSLGVTAKNDGTNTNIEYLVGPSFSFLERQLFLTVGGYAGRVQRLADNLYLGQPVQAATEITIQKNYCWHFGAAITYKIK